MRKRPDGGWEIRYRLNGRQQFESVAKALDRPALECTREDAERLLALRLRTHRRSAVALNTKIAGSIDQAAIIAQIDGIDLRPSPSVIDGAELRMLVGPIVYAYFHRREPIYVGMSQYGIARPFGRSHHYLKTNWRRDPQRIDQDDHIVIWPMRSVAEALAAERLVYEALIPDDRRRSSAIPAIPAILDKAERFGLL
jgi:hypothetical protein